MAHLELSGQLEQPGSEMSISKNVAVRMNPTRNLWEIGTRLHQIP